MKKQDVFDNYDKYILKTYTRAPYIFIKGKGSILTDIDGKQYLDFFPGWGVNNVGHCHPKVMAGVRDQIGKLIFVPNNVYHLHQAKLSKEIITNAFPGKVFFCNSGAEATEGAIKLAHAYGRACEGPEGAKIHRFEIITMINSFHGRTMGAISATGQPKYQEGFAPLVPGFKHIPFNDINALKNAITDCTIALMLEPVQGEGGINIAKKEYLQEIRKICDEKNILLILDEVQSGMGRTGEMFAFKHYGIIPDVMTLAKSLGGGLPIGALVVKDKFTGVLKPGMHASTFGGSPVICKASLGVFKAIKSEGMLKNAKVMGAYLVEKLGQLKEKFHCILEIRGLGLMVGVELSVDGKMIVEECLKNGLIINNTQGKVLRIMPALNVNKKQIDKAIRILEKAFEIVTK